MKKAKGKPSADAVRAAVRKFQRDGGVIKQSPPQPNYPRVAFPFKWADTAYETIQDFSL